MQCLSRSSDQDLGRHWRAVAISAITMCLATMIGSPASAQSPLTIELRRDLTLGDRSGTTFGDVLHLAVNSTGVIYVGDWMNTHVLAFAPDGTVLDTIGRRGNGPAWVAPSAS